MSSIHVTTSVNGDPAEFVCTPDESLLDVLRNRLGFTGAKEGCGTGDCGACSVTLNGRLVCSCLVLAAEVEGGEIDHRRRAWPRRMCCILCSRPSLITPPCNAGSARPAFWSRRKALLDKNPDPTDEEVRYWLAGNLCRCTGYDKIMRAVQSAAAQMRSA